MVLVLLVTREGGDGQQAGGKQGNQFGHDRLLVDIAWHSQRAHSTRGRKSRFRAEGAQSCGMTPTPEISDIRTINAASLDGDHGKRGRSKYHPRPAGLCRGGTASRAVSVKT
jgi:hypothetical protein